MAGWKSYKQETLGMAEKDRQLTPLERFDLFIEFQKKAEPYRRAEEERITKHAPDCYGTYRQCISCGCDRRGIYYGRGPVACVSHRNNKRLIEELRNRDIK